MARYGIITFMGHIILILGLFYATHSKQSGNLVSNALPHIVRVVGWGDRQGWDSQLAYTQEVEKLAKRLAIS